MGGGSRNRGRPSRIVVIDSVGRWKEEMFRHWNFGDLLLIAPRDLRTHWKEKRGFLRLFPRKRSVGYRSWVIDLPMLPGWLFHCMPFAARILARIVRGFAGGDRCVAVLTLPQYHRILDFLPAKLTTGVYFAYDDYAENWPERLEETQNAESQMAEKVDLILCAAKHRMQEFKLSPAGQSGRLYQLAVAAPDAWLEDLIVEGKAASFCGDFPAPRFLSFGALSGRIDFRYFEAVARRFPKGSVVLAGALHKESSGSAEWWAQAQSCLSLPNVHCTGWVAEDDRAELLRSADAFLMAHSACRFNLGSCPAKLWDYFGVGKPVVATENCPEVLEFRNLIETGGSPEAFGEAAERALAGDSSTLRTARRAAAAERSCSHVAGQLRRILEDSGAIPVNNYE